METGILLGYCSPATFERKYWGEMKKKEVWCPLLNTDLSVKLVTVRSSRNYYVLSASVIASILLLTTMLPQHLPEYQASAH
jgi:hypothetical protein